MANIKPIDQSSDKWQRRASVAGPDYQAGVQNPRTPWAAAATAGAGNYKQGVVAAANSGRYEAGVKSAGDAAWRDGAMSKGPSRYAEGVSLSTDKWQKGFAPYQSGISSLQLPVRGPKGSPQNLQRVAAVATLNRGIKDKMGK